MQNEENREIFEIEKPEEEEILWSGKPHVLCLCLKRSIIWLLLAILWGIFGYWFLGAIFVPLMFISNYRGVKGLKYYITKDYMIVQTRNTYWASYRKVIQEDKIAGDKIYNTTTRFEKWIRSQHDLIQPDFTQSFIEKLFDVKTFKFKHKSIQTDDHTPQDIYATRGCFFCIKDYKTVQSIVHDLTGK